MNPLQYNLYCAKLEARYLMIQSLLLAGAVEWHAPAKERVLKLLEKTELPPSIFKYKVLAVMPKVTKNDPRRDEIYEVLMPLFIPAGLSVLNLLVSVLDKTIRIISVRKPLLEEQASFHQREVAAVAKKPRFNKPIAPPPPTKGPEVLSQDERDMVEAQVAALTTAI